MYVDHTKILAGQKQPAGSGLRMPDSQKMPHDLHVN